MSPTTDPRDARIATLEAENARLRDREAALVEKASNLITVFETDPDEWPEGVDDTTALADLKEAIANLPQSAADWRKRVEEQAAKEAVNEFLTETFHQEIGCIAETNKFRESLLFTYQNFKPGDAYTWEVVLATAVLYWEEQATKPLREALSRISQRIHAYDCPVSCPNRGPIVTCNCHVGDAIAALAIERAVKGATDEL